MSQPALPDGQQAQTALCSDSAVQELVNGVNAQLWRSNALMVASAVLVAIMVAAGASGQRYRQAAVTRFLFLGASSLYLPIVSYVASSIGKESCSTSGLDVFCHGRSYVAMLLIWTVLVQIVGTSTSATVAADDYYDDGGQKLGCSVELLARAVWTSYLVFYYADRGFRTIISEGHVLDRIPYYRKVSKLLIVLCLLSLAKIMVRLFAFQKARKSYALGRNSRLVAGYMEKLMQGSDQLIPPPLIVMGEEKQEIEEIPEGYSIKQRNNTLVTLDTVWQMASTGDALLSSRPYLKDLCLSFALFKLLSRRFAKAHLAESGSAKAFNFVLGILISNGSPDRVFSVIADEISFMLDSYYSSLPTSYFGRLLPILNITVSLSIITWCLAGSAYISNHFSVHSHPHQIFCRPNPKSCKFPPRYLNGSWGFQAAFGNILFNTIPTISLVVAVVIAEAWEILSYLCSNWAKVTMLCNYITHASWQQSRLVQKWLGLLMKLKCRSSWRSDHMGQRSLLLAYQQQPSMRYALSRFICCFVSDPKMPHVKVQSKVKAAIVEELRRSNGTLSKGTTALHKSRIGGRFLWACQGQGTSDVILTWHIATCILEARHGGAASSTSSRPAHKRTVATHLSRYCAYLVTDAPELLPDDKAWSRKLYKTVSKDIRRALAGEPLDHDDGMAARLGERSENEVVKRGARLGKQLMELIPDEEARWALLVSFWCEILLYVAPSDNLKAHKKAIAQGTELVTLLWALLMHAGIVTRPSTGRAV